MRIIPLPKLGIRAAIYRALLDKVPQGARWFNMRRRLYARGWRDVNAARVAGMARVDQLRETKHGEQIGR